MRTLILYLPAVLTAAGIVFASAAAAAEGTLTAADHLAAAERPAHDRLRDAHRRPADVMAFLDVEPGMTVLDVVAADGYYTEVLARWVGDTGVVYAHNTPSVLRMEGGAADFAMAARAVRFHNIIRLDGNLDQFGLNPGSIDVIFTALTFHDIYHARGETGAITLLRQLAALLKPGGVIGLIDHAGIAGQNNARLHRIEEAHAREAIARAGLVIEAEARFLRNETDPHTQSVFAGGLRGKTDRFVYRLRAGG